MFQLILIIANAVLINIVFLTSFFIRYGSNIPDFNFESYKQSFAFLTVVYLLAFFFAGLFRKRFTSLWQLFQKIFVGSCFATLFGITLIYIFRIRWSSFPSSIFLISFFIGPAIFFAANILIFKAAKRISKKILIVGQNSDDCIIEQICNAQIHHIKSIPEIINHNDIDEIIITENIHDEKQLNLLIYLLLKLNVNVIFSPQLYLELLSANIMKKNSLEYLTTFMGRKSEFEEFLINAFDIVASIAMFIILSPLLLTVALLIKTTQKGSILYKQTRLSKNGKPFTLYKFKTMVDNAEKLTGPVLASENDPRVTKIGRFLRDTRLDELPQLINILKGDMSLVGPRPERPHFVKIHKSLRQARLTVKPGLTGFAQIRSLYDLDPKHKIKYDYLYIQKRSLLLNLYIIAKTLPVMILKKGR